jgi:hypothetical protein
MVLSLNKWRRSIPLLFGNAAIVCVVVWRDALGTAAGISAALISVLVFNGVFWVVQRRQLRRAHGLTTDTQK